jgi:hypothetical protein
MAQKRNGRLSKQSINIAAEEVLGTTHHKIVNGWFDQDSQTALGIGNKTRKKTLQRWTRPNALECADARKIRKIICHKRWSMREYHSRASILMP